MSVLSDKWIRKMSKEEGMISPFEEKQVRGAQYLLWVIVFWL
jgi:dCTP deaminase